MIVKNEEKYLEKCLTALKPILDNVDSELIIADTGSTDNTVEIAKKFTDNVFHFEWINDFAAARNSTLDRAQGEWYMFIDADEIIVDATELIEFFNSGEYKAYGAATYIVKNYNDLSRKDLFNLFTAHRLTAIRGGVRFEKPIHENFNMHFMPSKNLNVIADHYGYVFSENGKTLELAEKKTSRNLELLFEELEEGKRTGELKSTVYAQIADCYAILNKNEEALDYINQGLEKCDPENYVIINYYLKKIKLLNVMGRQEELIEVCQKYFSKENKVRNERFVTDCTVYFYWAAASYVLKNYDEVINKAVLGFDIYRSYHSGKLFTMELNFVVMEATIPMMKQVCNMFIFACVDRKRYNDAVRQLPNFPMDEFMADTEYMKSHLNIRNLFMDKTNYNTLPDLYYSLDKPNRENYINILIRHIFKAEKKEQFLKKLSTLSNEDVRLADILKIYDSYFIHHELFPRQTTEFIKKYGAKNNEAIWILMMKSHFDITPFICAEDFEVEESVDNLYIDVRQADAAMDLFDSSLYTLSKEGVEKAMTPFRRAVYTATEKRFNTTKVIRTFGNLGKRWKELNPDKEIPEDVDFALTLNGISDLHRKKHYDESIARIKELLGEDPEEPDENNVDKSDEDDSEEFSEGISEPEPESTFEPKPEKASEQPEEKSEQPAENASEDEKTKILRHYLLVIKLEKKRDGEIMEKHNENPEMMALAEQIKQEIRVMIDNWDLDGAEAALNQMARLAPFDADIESIRDEITDRKINYMNYM